MATDRAAIQAGCRWSARGRRGDRQCGRGGERRGRVIRHATTRPIRALAIAVIQAGFQALLVSPSRRAHRRPTGRLATRRRAVHVAAITAAADRKRLSATGTGTKAKRVVHGAASRCCHWTPVPIRDTKKATVLVPWSPRRSRGPGVPALGPHLVAAFQPTSTAGRPPTPHRSSIARDRSRSTGGASASSRPRRCIRKDAQQKLRPSTRLQNYAVSHACRH
jgi:hypothetical protein